MATLAQAPPALPATSSGTGATAASAKAADAASASAPLPPTGRPPTPRHANPNPTLLPPQLVHSSSGEARLPSYPLYCRYVLRAARTFLSPASSSLLYYALYFHFRQQTTKALHFLHLLYIKCMYVRVRDEQRRRAKIDQQRNSTTQQTTITGDESGNGNGSAPSSEEERELVRRLRSMALPPHPHPHSHPYNPDTYPSGNHMTPQAHPAAAAASAPAPTPTSDPDALALLVSPPTHSPPGHSPSGITSPHSPWSTRPSIIASLTAAGAAALSFPFSHFASLFSVFTEASMMAYCSVEWDRQELFLRANAQPHCSEDTVVCERKLGLHKDDHAPAATMMFYQLELASSLQPVSPAEQYAPRNDSQELEVLAILRTDTDLNHYPIDWASLLMLTHESFANHLARLQRSREHSNQTLAHATEVAVMGRASRALPPDAVMAPGAFAEVPLLSPLPLVPQPSHSSSFSHVVMHALQSWRAQKREQRRVERSRRATAPSHSVSGAPAALSTSPSPDTSDDICYVPLTARHRMERNWSESRGAASASSGNGVDDAAAGPHKPLSAAARRWQFLRGELHKRRLVRALHIQREFYLTLAKHKVLSHRSSPSTRRDGSTQGGWGAPRRNVSSSSLGTPTNAVVTAAASSHGSSVFRSASVPNLLSLVHEGASGGTSGASTPLLHSGAATPHQRSDSFSGAHHALSPVPASPTAEGQINLPLEVSSPAIPSSPPPASPTPPPRRPIAIFMAGGMSAGKSTVIAHLRCTDSLFDIADDAVLIEADKFKKVDPVYQNLPTSDPTRSLFVHSQSLITAEETLLAATRAGRDIIVDGTMSWLPYVSQTFDMIRHVHVRRYGRGPGFHVDGRTGDVTEKYWVACGEGPVAQPQKSGDRIAEAARLGDSFTFSPTPPPSDADEQAQCETIPPSESHLPYIICMLGVTADWPVAVTRAVRRAVSMARAVPIDKMLNSYVLFSRNFDAYADLVDAFMLFDNSADAEGGLTGGGSGEGTPRPTLVAARSLGQREARVVRADLWTAFRQQALLPTDATNAAEMVDKLRRVHEQQQQQQQQQQAHEQRGEPSQSQPQAEPKPAPAASTALVSLPPPSPPSLSQIYPPLSAVLPVHLRWLLSQIAGDDDVITEDDADEETNA